ncbi:hypothetical protein C8R42DRAFT_727596 [Lentinula raphanica]|nr:hypothetical protein C8R42DRAFT_727596 [Lentinula raphanica]
MFIPIGIVYLAFGLLTSTHGAPLYPTTATGRPNSKSKESAMGDDMTSSSLARRHVRRPFNYTINTHGEDSDFHSDSELDLDSAILAPTQPPLMAFSDSDSDVTYEDDDPPFDNIETYIWFSSEELPTSTKRTRSANLADVYPETQQLIMFAVNQTSYSSETLPKDSDVYYLERLLRSDRHFYLVFYRIPHADPRPVIIEGGGPFTHTLPASVPPQPFETHVWFTDAGRRRGPNSDVRFFSGHTGLSYKDAGEILKEVRKSLSRTRPPLDKHITVFQEEWKPEYRTAYWQTFHRDERNPDKLVESAIDGPGHFFLHLTPAIPALPVPDNEVLPLRSEPSPPRLASPPPRPASSRLHTDGNAAIPLRPASRRPVRPGSPTPGSPPSNPESPPSSPASHDSHTDENGALSTRPVSPRPHINANPDAHPPRTASTTPHVDTSDATPSGAASHDSHADENGPLSARPASPRPHINANLDAHPPRTASTTPHIEGSDATPSSAASHDSHADENGALSTRPASPRPHINANTDAHPPRTASTTPHIDGSDATPTIAASHDSHTDENGALSRRPSSAPHIDVNSDALAPHIGKIEATSSQAASPSEPHTNENGIISHRPASPRPHNHGHSDALPPGTAFPGPLIDKNDGSPSRAASPEPHTDGIDATSSKPASPGPHPHDNDRNGAV